MTKMTQKMAIAFVIEQFGAEIPADVLAKVQEVEKALSRKSKSTGERKPTATQVANEGFKAVIVEAMTAEPERLFTITEMCKEFDFDTELSNQRVSALITQLKKAAVVERIEEKGKAFFRLAQ